MDMAGIALSVVVMVAAVGFLVRLVMWPYITAKRIRNAVSSKADPRDRADAREELGETGRRVTSYFAVFFGMMILLLIFFLVAPLLPEFLRWILLIAGGIAGILLYSWAQNRI
jgi:hypothetical protein